MVPGEKAKMHFDDLTSDTDMSAISSLAKVCHGAHPSRYAQMDCILICVTW